MGMTVVQESAGRAVVVSNRPLVGLMHDQLKRYLSGSLDPEVKAFLRYTRDAESNGVKILRGKFWIFRNVDGQREAYFVFPSTINAGTPQRQKLTEPKVIPNEVKALVRERCEVVSLKFVRDDSHAGSAILGTLGRAGADCALGVLQEIIH